MSLFINKDATHNRSIYLLCHKIQKPPAVGHDSASSTTLVNNRENMQMLQNSAALIYDSSNKKKV